MVPGSILSSGLLVGGLDTLNPKFNERESMLPCNELAPHPGPSIPWDRLCIHLDPD